MKKKTNKTIFLEYDIRGKYPKEINEEECFLIGKAWAQILKKQSKKAPGCFLKNHKTAAISRDMRKGSPQLARALSLGLLSEKINVDYLEMSTTPALYWTVAKKEYLGGAIITASHNSSEFNGIKICGAGGRPVSPEDIWKEYKNLKREIDSPLHEERVGEGLGVRIHKGGGSGMRILQRKSYIEQYINFLKKFYNKKNRYLKVVVDAAWAMASEEIPFIFNGMNMDFIPLCFGPTENFSNKDINPANKGALDDLSKMVKKYNADLGIAFDGDADRVLFTDENGKIIDPELITAILSVNILKKKSKNKIIIDARSGKTSKNAIENSGGKIFVSKAGHINIKNAMRKNNAVFGAETSGHYFFKESYFADNAMIAMLKILNVLGQSRLPFSYIANDFRIVHKTNEINFKISNSQKVLEKIESNYSFESERLRAKDKKTAETKISHLDGLTIEHLDWRFNIRKSNTEEEILRLNAEANTENTLRKIISEITLIAKKQ